MRHVSRDCAAPAYAGAGGPAICCEPAPLWPHWFPRQALARALAERPSLATVPHAWVPQHRGTSTTHRARRGARRARQPTGPAVTHGTTA